MCNVMSFYCTDSESSSSSSEGEAEPKEADDDAEVPSFVMGKR